MAMGTSTSKPRAHRRIIGRGIAFVVALCALVASGVAVLVAEQWLATGEPRRLAQYSISIPRQWTIERLETTADGCLRRAEIFPTSGIPVLGRLWDLFVKSDAIVLDCRLGNTVCANGRELGNVVVYA